MMTRFDVTKMLIEEFKIWKQEEDAKKAQNGDDPDDLMDDQYGDTVNDSDIEKWKYN